ncbi:MAG: dihydrofolate reductase family protein [Aquisalimonadaceae bacterium]
MNAPICRLYIAISVDGYIATPDGGVDWLEPYHHLDTGIQDFMDKIGTVVMGRNTYEQVLQLGDWPYAGKHAVVLTSRVLAPPAGHEVQAWSGDPRQLLSTLRKRGDGDVWLMGGAMVVRQWLDLDLVDRLELYVIPVLLGDGIRLFRRSDHRHALELQAATTWPGGITGLHYYLIMDC